MRALTRAAALTAAAGASCVAYGTFVEAASYRVRRVTVPILEPGAEPLRVLHLSDVHLLPWNARRIAFLRSLAGLEPDLVICTGDNLSSPASLTPFIDALGRLLDAPGAFVFGSNDFDAPSLRNPLAYLWRTTEHQHDDGVGAMPTDELRAAFSARGWLDLNEHKHELTIRGQRFELRGTGDAHENRDDYAPVAGPVPNGVVGLGLTHAPYARMLDAMASDGVQLVFSGHTHGGQVCVPLYGALTTNCDLPTKLAKGLHRHRTPCGAETWVNVSAGVGVAPYAPFRFACPPEVSLLTLTAPASHEGDGRRAK